MLKKAMIEHKIKEILFEISKVLYVAPLIFIYSVTCGQDSINIRNSLIIGKWTQCHDRNLNKLYKCDSINYIYVFKLDNTYTEQQEFPSTHESYFMTGKWSLDGSILTIDRDDTESTKFYPIIKKIKWVNDDFFYFTGREGKRGPIIYTYYQRIK